ncbi:MAG: V-type ATP synthase subunit I [Spirochaetales bacterium]
MIVPMKKATVLVLESRKEHEVENLKLLGLLHPEIEQRTDERVEALREQSEAVVRALGELPPEAEGSADGAPAASIDEGLKVAHHINNLADHRRGRTEVSSKIDTEIMRVRRWGQFDPDQIRELREQGIDIHLYAMSPKDYKKKAPEGHILLEKDGASARFAIVWFHGETSCGLTPKEVEQISGVIEFRLPDISLAELEKRREEELSEVARVSEEIESLAEKKPLLEETLAAIEARLRDNQVRLNMDSEERVAYITGYLPTKEVDALKQAARNNGWGVLVRDPEPDDPVPTKIKNPAFIRIVRPVFDLLGVVPGYRERDISFFFLLFFIVFVGMIIGDAGYGVILFLGAIVGLVKGRGKNGLALSLLLVLSLSTIAWGGMSGNWFGYEPIGETPPFNYLTVPVLDSFDPASVQAVQAVCFVLAVVHLSIAHVWNFFRELKSRPRLRAFAQLGWWSILLALYMLVVSLFLGTTFPNYGIWMIIGGIAVVFLFSGQSTDTGFFGGVLNGLKGAFTNVFDVIGAFSDIISYIRLFAVGLASVAIAQAFNEMAASIGFEGPAIAGAILVLLFGHTLNLIMGGLAVIVHGVRLNLLEFSGHVGMEWTGTEYQPFAKSNRKAS